MALLCIRLSRQTVDAAKAEGANYVIAIAHLGMDGIDRTLDLRGGHPEHHRHRRRARRPFPLQEYSKTVANKDGEQTSCLAQTEHQARQPRQADHLADGKITTELISTKDYTNKDERITELSSPCITDKF